MHIDLINRYSNIDYRTSRNNGMTFLCIGWLDMDVLVDRCSNSVNGIGNYLLMLIYTTMSYKCQYKLVFIVRLIKLILNCTETKTILSLFP